MAIPEKADKLSTKVKEYLDLSPLSPVALCQLKNCKEMEGQRQGLNAPSPGGRVFLIFVVNKNRA